MCAPCNLRKGAKSWRGFLARRASLACTARPVSVTLGVLRFIAGLIKGLVIVPLAILFIGFVCLALFGFGRLSRLFNGVIGVIGLVPLISWAWRGPTSSASASCSGP